MRPMITALIGSLLCISPAMASDLTPSLKPFSPLAVTVTGNQLTIQLAQPAITDALYSTVLKNGVCDPVWSGNAKALDGITEVAIINQHAKQGFVFEGGAPECQALGELSGNASAAYVLGKTHLYP